VLSSAAPQPTSCHPDLCSYTGQLILARPIAPPGRDTIDGSYRFGSMQGGQRDPHHGVEFLNPSGTPVQAAADGIVVVAGDDRQTFYGPYSYFYGNLVVLEHSQPDLPERLYTLYGHLSQLSVQVGDRVRAGQVIGQVGMSGVATGSHLHFEVRLGENTYEASRNPELWLAPLAGPEGEPTGALAGRIVDDQDNPLPVESIVLEHLPAPDQPADFTLYAQMYTEKALIGQPPFKEGFGAGDLPAGWYRISFVQYGMQNRMLEVQPGQLTVVTFRLSGGN
jgi:murein DD-endopeptidase MepM/ murein hydrolase activator NlpD